MNDGWSKFNSRPRLTAAICFAYAAATVLSLNTLLPIEMNHRHYIGWGFLLLALFMVGVGLAALYGSAVGANVAARWQRWSVTRRVVICTALYIGVSVCGHIACDVYEVLLRRWAYDFLPPSISWWCQ